MENKDKHLQSIKSNIEKCGHHLYVIKDTGALPRFCYTIGLTQEIGSELILAGALLYSDEEVKDIIDEIIREIENDINTERVTTSLGVFTLKTVDGIIGNSSSGIIEAASFCKPVVNIGNRQQGRIRGINVIDCTIEELPISITLALSNDFKIKCQNCINIYGDGRASKSIVNKLISEPLLSVKKFIDINPIHEIKNKRDI